MWFSIRLAVSPGSLRRLQLGLLQQTYETIEATGFTQCSQVMPYARTAIGAVAALEALPDKPCKSGIVLAALAGPTVKPFIKTAVGHRRELAHRAGRPKATMPSNKAELHCMSFAK